MSELDGTERRRWVFSDREQPASSIVKYTYCTHTCIVINNHIDDNTNVIHIGKGPNVGGGLNVCLFHSAYLYYKELLM